MTIHDLTTAMAVHFASLLLLLPCSCAPAPHAAAAPRPALPADVRMNPDAGRGAWLFVNVRLDDGPELPFFIDTGTNYTCFDKSLAPRLGRRLGVVQGRHYDDVIAPDLYAAPKLYLGSVPLMTADRVLVMDLSKPSVDAGRPVAGILGMDCLRHYCVQLDFDAGKIRFLDPDRAAAGDAQLGRTFPLMFRSRLPWLSEAGLVPQATTPLLIDTGNRLDGALESDLFESKVREQSLRVEVDKSGGRGPRIAGLSNALWSGDTYTDLVVRGGVNSIGLRFLARHVVTLNFPKQTMSLRRLE